LAVRASDKGERRRSTAHRALADGPSLEEVLRQVGEDIVNEPIPESLLQSLLPGKRCEAVGRPPLPFSGRLTTTSR